VPWSDVVGARVVDAKDARQRLLLRTMGTGLTGVVKAGRFTVRGEPGAREFWATYRDPEFLPIDTTQLLPERIMLQVPDRVELAGASNARVAR
jgi:hypothetical protein